MKVELRTRCARIASYVIRRNPLYLISAVAMAIAARRLLLDADARAGEVGRMLLTLGVLQLYELAVGVVLVALHAGRRSPEDRPSLLLVAALFWTGPLAATLEMCAADDALGIGFSIAAGIIALGELRIVNRTLGLRMSTASHGVAAACLVLISAAPMVIRASHGEGAANELALYTAWWLLAGLALALISVLRAGTRHWGDAASVISRLNGFGPGLWFALITITAAATHLYGMNYAFFVHARLFYAGPLVIAATVVGIELFGVLEVRSGWMLGGLAMLPALAVGAALEGFDTKVAVGHLPLLVRDPLLTSAVWAACAYWFGALRLNSSACLHLGTAALAVGLARIIGEVDLTPSAPMIAAGSAPAPLLIVWCIYAAAAYLLAVSLLRRTRLEAIAALTLGWTATTLLVWKRIELDVFVASLAAAWTAIVILHIWLDRPRWFELAAPVVLLVAMTCGFEYSENARNAARAHAIALPLILLALSVPWQQCGYRLLALLTGVGEGGFYVTVVISRAERPLTLLAALAAFAMLLAGGLVSWHKERLLGIAAARAGSDVTEEDSANAALENR